MKANGRSLVSTSLFNGRDSLMALRVLPRICGMVFLVAGLAPVTSSVLAQQAGLSPDGRLTVTAAANGEIQRYVQQVSSRFGALAVSQDGTRAVSYVCQSRLWKNCDEPGSEDSNIAIPSGKIARDEALTRCRSQSGAACILVFINDDQQREFAVQP
jgi:hypothetical protein